MKSAVRAWAFGGVAALGLMASGATAQEAPWGNAEVDAYVSANKPKTAAQSADPFAVPAPPSAPAAAVVLSYPIPMKGRETEPVNGVTAPAMWEYDPVNQTMKVTAYNMSTTGLLSLETQGVQLGGGLLGPRIHGYGAFRSENRSAAGTGQNAYGAQVEMSRVMTTVRGFGELSTSFDAPIPGNETSGLRYEHSWAIAPDQARELSQHLVWQIVGTTGQWAPGKWVICGTDYSGATVRNPVIHVADECYLTGTLSLVRLVDDRDGTVLRQWERRGAGRRR